MLKLDWHYKSVLVIPTPAEEVQRAVPKNVLLQDDTLLERVVYSDPKTTPPPRLTSLEQAVVLGQW